MATSDVPAREMFETAEALFTVEKRELQLPVYGLDQISIKPTGTFGVVRTDTQGLLGVVSKQYEIVQNDSLLRMAEFIREEVQMDTVTVLSDGARVAFTANVRGTDRDIVPGDTIKRRFVGYLGHDGKTGCGAMFTNIRVVCSNTLATAMRSAQSKLSISHKGAANENFDRLIQSIDIARQSFDQEVEIFRSMTDVSMTPDMMREYLERVYAPQLAKPVTDGGVERDRQLEDLRIYNKVMRAYNGGFGAQEFAPGTMWSAVNAVTEIETSTKLRTKAEAQRQFNRANFGQGLVMSRRAIEVASDMLTTV